MLDNKARSKVGVDDSIVLGSQGRVDAKRSGGDGLAVGRDFHLEGNIRIVAYRSISDVANRSVYSSRTEAREHKSVGVHPGSWRSKWMRRRYWGRHLYNSSK